MKHNLNVFSLQHINEHNDLLLIKEASKEKRLEIRKYNNMKRSITQRLSRAIRRITFAQICEITRSLIP